MKTHSVKSPNYSYRPQGIRSVIGGIIHHTASRDGSGLAIARMFQNRACQVSAHDVIDNDGTVYLCVPYHLKAWHAGTSRYDFNDNGRFEPSEYYLNGMTLGWELVNRGDGRDTFPDAQLKSLAARIRHADRICPNFKLRDITDHEEVSLSGKIDMRKNFPAAKVFWWVLHPRSPIPAGGAYNHLPRWAQKQVDEIKKGV